MSVGYNLSHQNSNLAVWKVISTSLRLFKRTQLNKHHIFLNTCKYKTNLLNFKFKQNG